MQVAALDLGTNTFHLLLAETEGEKYFVQDRYKFTVHLGREFSEKRRISAAAERRAAIALQHFASTLRQARPLRTMAVATAAFRMAENGEATAQRLQSETGITFRIISGEEEAELIYEGIRSDLPKDNLCLCLDIGGGSTECSIADSERIHWTRSFDVGAQGLLHRFLKADPMPFASQEQLRAELREQLATLLSALRQHKPSCLLGSSGTFTTLYSMYAEKQSLSSLRRAKGISPAVLKTVYEPLFLLPREERLQLPGMSPTRVDMLVLGALIVDFLTQQYTFEKVIVSAYGLKEGVLRKLSTQ